MMHDSPLTSVLRWCWSPGWCGGCCFAFRPSIHPVLLLHSFIPFAASTHRTADAGASAEPGAWFYFATPRIAVVVAVVDPLRAIRQSGRVSRSFLWERSLMNGIDVATVPRSCLIYLDRSRSTYVRGEVFVFWSVLKIFFIKKSTSKRLLKIDHF